LEQGRSLAELAAEHGISLRFAYRKVGHRITGNRQQGRSYGVGHDKVHVAVDNGPPAGLRLQSVRQGCRILGLRHIRPRPSTARTNGKAERLIQTL
jgi:transposase InsO family protein